MSKLIKKIYISITLFLPCAFCLAADGKGPGDYFHKGSNSYIDKKTEAAEKTVEEGLQAYPNERKLQALKKLLKQQQQQKKDQEQKQEDKQKQDKERDQQNKEQEDKKRQDQQDKQQQEQKQQKQDEQQEQAKPEEMTEEEARMLLDAMEQEEKAKREKMKIMMGKPQHVEKNW